MGHTRWRPFSEFEAISNDVGLLSHTQITDLATDIYEDKNNVYIEINVPGINHEKIDISVHDDHVRISGSREEKEETIEKDYYHREIRRGSFERILTLPCEVDEKKAKAELVEGVLAITLPKKEAPQEHKVKITPK